MLKSTGWHLSELRTPLRCNALSERHKIIKQARGEKKKAYLWKGFLHSWREGTLEKCFVCEIGPADVVLLCCCRLSSCEHNSRRGVPQSRSAAARQNTGQRLHPRRGCTRGIGSISKRQACTCGRGLPECSGCTFMTLKRHFHSLICDDSLFQLKVNMESTCVGGASKPKKLLLLHRPGPPPPVR